MHILPVNKGREKAVILSSRLSAIAESLPNQAVVCDVGSDHGDLPLYLLQNKKSPRVVVTDLNPLPLARAKKNISDAGYASLAEFVLTDGIEEVLSLNPHVFVIAGMGGETISGILQRAINEISIGTQFVLQPMTKTPLLRKFLYENGFSIQNEKIIFENEKFFPILWVEFSGEKQLEKLEKCFLGEHLILQHSEVVKLYFNKLLEQTNAKIDGRLRAGADVSFEKKEKEQLEMLLKEFV